MASPLTLPQAMESFYKSHVDCDEKLRKENSKIVVSFVNDVKSLLVENAKDLPVSVGNIEKQGSAFEGLKVGKPDEFDFAIQYRIKKCKDLFVFVEGRTIGATLPDNAKAAGFYKIELKSREKSEDWIKSKLVDEWPGGGKMCLSPRKVVQRVQSAMDKGFPNLEMAMAGLSVSAGASGGGDAFSWRQHVKSIKRQSKGNPALTVGLTMNDGSIIDVDISPCIVDSEGQHFVPKRHPRLSGQGKANDPYEMLWMRTESQKELEVIKNIDTDGGERRKCMRILKAAIASKDTPFSQFHSSYIVKTAWLHVVAQDDKKSKDKWKGWEVLALRLKDILLFLEKAFKDKQLISRFNKAENILVKFNDSFLNSCAGYLKGLNNKLRSGDIPRFITDLGLDGSGTARTSML